MLKTEGSNPRHADLDLYPLERLVEAFVDDQAQAVAAVRAALPQLTAAVEAAVPRLAAGGRLLYAGAGTSGRLGVLDSVELWPTFSWPPERALACIAGGEGAVFRAVEGAEDDAPQGHADLRALSPGPNDVLVALAVSGTTPYVLGAVEAARAGGALAVAVVNNPGSPLAQAAHVAIELDTGAEVIAGSTRLKAGTAQKIVVNTFSSAVMVRLHKVYRNLMVDLQPTNEKLRDRRVRVVAEAAGTDEAQAAEALAQEGQDVRRAIVRLSCTPARAGAALARLEASGNLRTALADQEASTPPPKEQP